MFRIMETAKDSVIEMEIKGDVTKEDYQRLEAAIQQELEKDDKVNIICIITELSDITAKAILEDFKMGVRHYRNIEKIAVVSSKDWVEWMAKLGAVLPVEIKHFGTHEIEQARNWIDGRSN